MGKIEILSTHIFLLLNLQPSFEKMQLSLP